MLINNKNNYFIYSISEGDLNPEGSNTTIALDNSNACLKAIDKYLDEVLEFGSLCSVTQTFWETNVSNDVDSSLNTRVSFANGFCKKDLYKIKNVLVVEEMYPSEESI